MPTHPRGADDRSMTNQPNQPTVQEVSYDLLRALRLATGRVLPEPGHEDAWIAQNSHGSHETDVRIRYG
jgi:hypothetical protein